MINIKIKNYSFIDTNKKKKEKNLEKLESFNILDFILLGFHFHLT